MSIDNTLNGSRPSAKGTATNRLSHIALTNVLNGQMVEWLEHVSDAEYMRQA
jgi:hypothetical protein